MMQKIKQRLNENQFFIQILLLVISAITITAAITIFIFISITERNVVNNYRDSHQLIINEVVTNYNTMFEDAISLMDTFNNQNTLKNYMITQNQSTVDDMNLSYSMTRFMKDIDSKLKSLKANLFITGDQGIYYGFDDVRINADEILMNQPIFADHDDPSLRYNIIPTGLTTFTKDKPQFLVHRNLYDDKDQYYGHIVLSFSLSDLDYVYQRLTPRGQDLIYFMNEDDEIVHTASTIPFNDSMYEDQQYIYTEDKLPIPGIRMLSFINKSSLKNEVYRINTLILSISALCGIFAILLFQVVRKLTNPIYALSDSLDNVNLEKIDKQTVGGTYEIQQLTDSYNHMLEDVNHYIKNILELEEKKTQSDLTALLRQISPHFIYNTLTSIRFLIMSNQNEKAAIALEDFIVMLQSLTHFDQGLIQLKDEKNLLDHYARLSQLRFGSLISVHITMSPDLYEYQIPQLILQPIVENAFFHAFGKEGGFVNLTFSTHDTDLIIEIMDNGKGMNAEQLALIEQNMQEEKPLMHVGISNVHQRITLEFGPDYGVHIYSEPNKGTIVTIRLPIIT